MGYLAAVQASPDDQVSDLIAEIVGQEAHLRHSAPARYVFTGRVRDLAAWLFHDGWAVENGRLVTLAAAVEEGTGVRDRLIDELANSGLDGDGALHQALDEAATAFWSIPPDFNEATTKVRIALETVARRAAPALAARRTFPPPNDTWGAALSFLRTGAAILTLQEEQALSSMYTLISPGAHRPIGITEEEWARLARTFSLSATYFLVRKYRTAS
jgi:hypothetical protein